ncbi:MAG: oligosaccharide flippase family protein [Traorella sp.]
MSNKRKQSIIFGGLISSAGVFLSKVLGLVYVIPFNMIAGSNNILFYGYAYNIYSYLLNISTAGIPFAIATLVAKYYNVKDYKTALLIKKISIGLMMALGFIGMCSVILMSSPIANMILAGGSNPEDFQITKNVLIIISFALFFVPVLSGYRGFYQGLKRMELYAFSQVLEQLVRVFFLLGAGALAVYVFHKDQIWSVYFAVFSASVAAICALLHIKKYDRNEMIEFKKLASEQERVSNNDIKVLLQEIILISIPYLLSSIIAYSSDMIDLAFFAKALESTGIVAGLCNFIYGTVISVHTKKIIAIPQILAIGFSASLIPYITTALENKNYKEVCKHIKDTLESVLYIVLPLSICLFFFSKEVMYLLYGNETIKIADAVTNSVIYVQQLDFEDYIMRFRSLDAVFGTIAPLFTSLLIACRLRKESLISLGVGAILKLIMLYPCTQIFGLAGATCSNMFYYSAIIGFDVYFLNKKYHINWKYTLRKLIVILLGLLGSSLTYLILSMIFKDITRFGRIGMVPFVVIEGIIVLIVYLGITSLFQLPQKIFRISFNDIKRKLKRK